MIKMIFISLANLETSYQESGVIPVALGGIFSACVILIIAIAVFLIRYLLVEYSGSNQKEYTCTAGLSIFIGFNALLLPL